MKKSSVSKKPILAGVIAGVMLFAVGTGIVLNMGRVSAEEAVTVNLSRLEQSIDDQVKTDPLLAYSSNPYDYVQNNEYYDNIVKLGIEALPPLESALQASDSNGLCEYIIAIAIEEISQANVNGILEKTYGWDNAKEFQKEWAEIRKTASKDVKEIIVSPELSAAQKIEKLTPYGVLAVPAMESVLREKSTESDFAEQMSTLLDKYSLSQSEKAILDAYVG